MLINSFFTIFVDGGALVLWRSVSMSNLICRNYEKINSLGCIDSSSFRVVV